MAKFWNLVSQATDGMRPPPPPDAPRRPLALVGGDGRVIADLPCHQCGYDVRGLSIDGSCPECNFPVRHSVRGNVLIYSDPRWLRRVARGAKWMGGAGVIGFIAGVTWVGTFSGLAAIVFLATVATFLAGAWMTTTADPSGIDDARSGRLRLTARSLLIAGLFVAPVAQLRGHVPIPEGMIRTATWLLLACGFGGAIALPLLSAHDPAHARRPTVRGAGAEHPDVAGDSRGRDRVDRLPEHVSRGRAARTEGAAVRAVFAAAGAIGRELAVLIDLPGTRGNASRSSQRRRTVMAGRDGRTRGHYHRVHRACVS
jgi:hypothetical protein